MNDLTTGPVTKHLLKTTSFMLVTMVFQTLYFLVDLYWVGKLGTDAVAAVSVAGNLTFIVLALTQMLGVGTTTVISHATGRKDHGGALLAFNQAQVLAVVTGVAFLLVGMLLRLPYSNRMAADAISARLAAEYLLWFIPAMALQFALVSMGSALRGIGNFKPGMIVGTVTVIINMILAPFLIFGWVTGRAFGVAGAAISSLVAIIIGIVWYAMYFTPRDAYLRFIVADWKPKLEIWKRMLAIGLPAGFEFSMMAIYLFLVYSITRPFGAAAQAGFGIGGRVVQAGFMPVVALGFSVAPVAGQNFGAMLPDRVKHTFRDASLMASGLMFAFAILCHIVPHALVRIFSNDPAVIEVGDEYLRIVSYTFIPSGLIFVASSMFQAMGNTVPSLIASAVRLLLIAIPLIFLTKMNGFQLNWIWYLSATAVFIQMVLSLSLLRMQFARRLQFGPARAESVPA